MKHTEAQSGSAASSAGYRCYLLDAQNRIVRRIDLAAATDDAARIEAQAVLAGSDLPAAEIWCLGRVVGRIGQPGSGP